MQTSENIRVFIRPRPLLPSESSISIAECILPASPSEIIISPPSNPSLKKTFFFDHVFEKSDKQAEVYETGAFSLVEDFMNGFNATLFLYGQTASGKTHTMMGEPSDEGIVVRAFEHVMSVINSSSVDKRYSLRMSALEIYEEEIHDLLNKKAKLSMRESPQGFFIPNLTSYPLLSSSDFLRLLSQANSAKAINSTQMNAFSSRSHTVFQLKLSSGQSLNNNVVKNSQDDMNTTDNHCIQNKLQLVDLAGSERQKKTLTSRERFREGVQINLSLSALGNVIWALSESLENSKTGKTSKKTHIPYRDSKLTKFLQDSLGGTGKTVMIACVSTCALNYEESLSTLRYAERTKKIKNNPKKGEEEGDIKVYREEIEKLKKVIEGMEKGRRKEVEEEVRKREEELKKLGDNEIKGQNNEDERNKLDTLRKKLKKQRKKEEELREEKEHQLISILEFDEKFKTQQEELEALRGSSAPLRNKYKEICFELSEFQRETELERECFLNTIREGQHELGFYEELVKMIFTSSEMTKIRLHTYWCEEKEKYLIPPFLFKDKTIKFPKLNQLDGLEVVESEKQGRKLVLGEKNVKKEKVFHLMEKKPELTQKLFPNLAETERNKENLAKPGGGLEEKKAEEVRMMKRPKRKIPNLTVTGVDSPNLADRTKKKKEYLFALDSMIQKFSEKYSKVDDIPSNFSQNYTTSQSFVNLHELEKDLDINIVKTKKNLNKMLEPIDSENQKEVLQELIQNGAFVPKTANFKKRKLP